MTKQELVRDMKQSQGGASFINKTNLAKYIGVDVHNVKQYVDGLDRINKRYYFIPDVAERILSMR